MKINHSGLFREDFSFVLQYSNCQAGQPLSKYETILLDFRNKLTLNNNWITDFKMHFYTNYEDSNSKFEKYRINFEIKNCNRLSQILRDKNAGQRACALRCVLHAHCTPYGHCAIWTDFKKFDQNHNFFKIFSYFSLQMLSLPPKECTLVEKTENSRKITSSLVHWFLPRALAPQKHRLFIPKSSVLNIYELSPILKRGANFKLFCSKILYNFTKYIPKIFSKFSQKFSKIFPNTSSDFVLLLDEFYVKFPQIIPNLFKTSCSQWKITFYLNYDRFWAVLEENKSWNTFIGYLKHHKLFLNYSLFQILFKIP